MLLKGMLHRFGLGNDPILYLVGYSLLLLLLAKHLGQISSVMFVRGAIAPKIPPSKREEGQDDKCHSKVSERE